LAGPGNLRELLMAEMRYPIRFVMLVFLLGLLASVTGCHVVQPGQQQVVIPSPGAVGDDTPRELYKATLPMYVIEPPDVLQINAIQLVPKTPYHVKTFDTLSISVMGTLPDAPIQGIYPIKPGGIIDLGFHYGTVRVLAKTEDEIKTVIEEHLKQFLREPMVNVTIADMAATQQVAGPHLVLMDGTVNLGTYGFVSVVGKTIPEAQKAIEQQLSKFLDQPEITIDVTGYNSKVFYVITQGGGGGDRVNRMPVTGNETVLDVISQVGGLQPGLATKIWIARAGRDWQGRHRILPIDWDSITQYGEIETNYQVLPGDRIYIAEDKLSAFVNKLGMITAPLESIAGFASFGVGTATRYSGAIMRGGGNRNSQF